MHSETNVAWWKIIGNNNKIEIVSEEELMSKIGVLEKDAGAWIFKDSVNGKIKASEKSFWK